MLAILIMGTLPLATNAVKRDREIRLRETLRQIRSAIDEFKRDTNGACAAWIFFSASVMSLPPPTFAGSLFGPISTKSLHITGKRLTP